MGIIEKERKEAFEKMEILKSKAKEISELMKNLPRDSEEYSILFETRSDILQDSKAIFMGLSFAGIL